MPTAKALEAECRQQRDKIITALCAELGATPDQILAFPDVTTLGQSSATLCQDWIFWLMSNDPDGDTEITCAVPGRPALKFDRQTALCLSRGKRGYLKMAGYE